jgi:hypothetical protein
VRADAADSIGRIRPITAQAGYALEQARDNDRSLPVRIAARTALFQYRILGYFTGVKEDLAMQTSEPPLAVGSETASIPGGTVLRPTPSPVPVAGPVTAPIATKPVSPSLPAGPAAPKPAPETSEPPIAQPSKPAPQLTSPPRAAAGPLVRLIPRIGRGSDDPAPAKPVANVKPFVPAPMELPAELAKPAPKPAPPIEGGPMLPPPPK